MTTRPAKEAFLYQLVAEGVEHVFGNPGTTELPFTDALVDAPDLSYVLGLNEAVVIGAADAYARVTGRPSFSQLHIAAGLGNAIGMLYNAHRGNTPMVVYVGQSPSEGMVREPHLFGDLVAMAGPVTKWAYEVRHARDLPLVVRRAFKVAATPPQGPVVVSVPADVLDEPVPDEPAHSLRVDWRTAPSSDALAEAAQLLRAAQRPVILAGDRIALQPEADLATQILELAGTVGAPVYTVYPSVAAFDVCHPSYAGQLPFTTPEAQRSVFADADVLVCIGCRPETVVLAEAESVVPAECSVVHLDDEPWALGRDHPRTLPVLGSVEMSVPSLLEAVAAEGRGARPLWRPVEQVAPAGVVADLVAAVIYHAPDGTLFYDDGATASPVISTVAGRPGRYWKNRGGGLGAGIPAGVGMALAQPDRRTVVFVSDGSALFTIQGLWTAAHLNLPVSFLVLDNGGYQVLRNNMASYRDLGDRKVVGVDLVDPPVGFGELAHGFGVPSAYAASPAEWSSVISWALEGNGPKLAQVWVQP